MGKDHMQRIMHRHGIRAKGKRRFKAPLKASTTCPLSRIFSTANSTRPSPTRFVTVVHSGGRHHVHRHK